MDTPRYEIETHQMIHDNQNGECIKVGPDRDGLGLIEIIQSENNLVITVEQAELLAKALNVCVNSMKKYNFTGE